jgi:CheY-like chemotaxis protein/anti-sigma regulatory factor (Ser/Thr protein kinase)
MPIILVVDDSPVDRKLIEGLLKPKLDWIVEFAENGAQGLELIDSIFPDVVITDLQMPEMDGIELCSQAKSRFPQVPIILITGKGSEELAMKALGAGATSYVPKSALSSSLLETVEQVISLSHQFKSQDFLRKHNISTRYQFVIDNNPQLIAEMVEFVKGNMEKLELGDQADRRHCAVALEEALLNSMLHGNLQLDGIAVQEARRAFHDGLICDAVQERLADSRCRDRRIRIAVEFSKREVKIIVRDDGPGFDSPNRNGSNTDLSQFSGAGGRGLTLIRSFMDEVQFNDQGNELRMLWKCDAKRKSPV